MRKLAILFILVVSTVMFSSPSYAEWTKLSEVGEGATRGDTFYVDFTRIRKVEGYIYFWTLNDFSKPTESGSFSSKVYSQGDCKLFRLKFLSFYFHKEPMGGGTGQVVEPTGEQANWKYPAPNTSGETMLKQVCSR